MYRVRTDDQAKEQIAALPGEALISYLQVLGVLELVPWNGTPYNRSKPDGNMRQMVFGTGGHGPVTYLILDDQRIVDILEVTSIG